MFEAGALVLLPFPYSDATTTKRRPVLALTSPDEYGDFIGMAVSSRSHHVNTVPLQNDSLVEGQLPKPSWIRVDRVVTLTVMATVPPLLMKLAMPVSLTSILSRKRARRRSNRYASFTLNASLVSKVFAQTKAGVHRQAVSGLCEMLQKHIPQA